MLYFGVRACDARSFSILDKVFLADPVDTYYQARREHGIVVSMACHRPAGNLFLQYLWTLMQLSQRVMLLTWIDRGYPLLGSTDTRRARALTKKVEAVLAESDSKAVEAQQAAVKEILKKLPLADLDLSYFTSHPEI